MIDGKNGGSCRGVVCDRVAGSSCSSDIVVEVGRVAGSSCLDDIVVGAGVVVIAVVMTERCTAPMGTTALLEIGIAGPEPIGCCREG